MIYAAKTGIEHCLYLSSSIEARYMLGIYGK